MTSCNAYHWKETNGINCLKIIIIANMTHNYEFIRFIYWIQKMANWNTCSGKDSYSRKEKLNEKKLPTGVLSLSREQEIAVTTTQLYNKFEQQLEVRKLAKLLLTVKWNSTRLTSCTKGCWKRGMRGFVLGISMWICWTNWEEHIHLLSCLLPLLRETFIYLHLTGPT